MKHKKENSNHSLHSNENANSNIENVDNSEINQKPKHKYVLRRRKHRGSVPHGKIYKKRKIRAWSVILVVTICAFGVSKIPPFTTFSISPLIIAVVLGAFFGNISHDLLHLFKKTNVIGYSTKQILRLGIILYGFRITFDDISYVGFNGILMGAGIVFSTFFIGFFLGRMLGLDRKSAVLVSAGSSICGAAAVLATESIIKGGAQRVGVAVCTVVVFGTLCMFGFPIAYKMGILHLDIKEIGFFMGGTLHEVAHAVAAGSAVGGVAAKITVIIKMLRVLMLVPFLIMIGLGSSFFTGSKEKNKGRIRDNIPYFAIWFLVVVGLGSFIPTAVREAELPVINFIDTFLLSVSMVALGLTIRKDVLKNAGAKPFVLAIVLLGWLIGFGYFLSSILV